MQAGRQAGRQASNDLMQKIHHAGLERFLFCEAFTGTIARIFAELQNVT